MILSRLSSYNIIYKNINFNNLNNVLISSDYKKKNYYNIPISAYNLLIP